MASTAPHSKRRSHGWWKLLSGVLFAFGATLGLGFYLPLRQTHRLLTKELASAQSGQTQLKESLASSEAKVQQLTAERAELQGFKSQVDTETQRLPKLMQDFAAQADTLVAIALSKKTAEVRSVGDGLGLAFTHPSLLTSKRNAPSASGEKLLCPAYKSAARAGLSEVTVRTFVAIDAKAPDAEMAYSNATTLALTVALRLTQLCGLRAGVVSVASSPAKDDALVQVEFRAPEQTGHVGL